MCESNEHIPCRICDPTFLERKQRSVGYKENNYDTEQFVNEGNVLMLEDEDDVVEDVDESFETLPEAMIDAIQFTKGHVNLC